MRLSAFNPAGRKGTGMRRGHFTGLDGRREGLSAAVLPVLEWFHGRNRAGGPGGYFPFQGASPEVQGQDGRGCPGQAAKADGVKGNEPEGAGGVQEKDSVQCGEGGHERFDIHSGLCRIGRSSDFSSPGNHSFF